MERGQLTPGGRLSWLEMVPSDLAPVDDISIRAEGSGLKNLFLDGPNAEKS